MEKEVARWLHQQLGYNAAADSTLSANCRGNLKSLWEFLMANYKSTENQRHIHNVLAKHRREQEAARQAPELLQQALQQRQHLAQLDAKAATLERTLASLQVMKPAMPAIDWMSMLCARVAARMHQQQLALLITNTHAALLLRVPAVPAGSCRKQYTRRCRAERRAEVVQAGAA
jgi:Trp operon repressor